MKGFRIIEWYRDCEKEGPAAFRRLDEDVIKALQEVKEEFESQDWFQSGYASYYDEFGELSVSIKDPSVKHAHLSLTHHWPLSEVLEDGFAQSTLRFFSQWRGNWR